MHGEMREYIRTVYGMVPKETWERYLLITEDNTVNELRSQDHHGQYQPRTEEADDHAHEEVT
jgi:hypothetical protein